MDGELRGLGGLDVEETGAAQVRAGVDLALGVDGDLDWGDEEGLGGGGEGEGEGSGERERGAVIHGWVLTGSWLEHRW